MIEEFDGFEREFTIPGLWLTKFLGTRVDFELTLTNCVGDWETYRNFVEVTSDPIQVINAQGGLTMLNGTNCE